MNIETMRIANSPLTFILCAIPIAFVLIQAVLFLRRALKMGSDIEMDKAILKKVVINSAVFSVVPTLPIVIMLGVLMPVLGKFIPWLRLSVIGSFMYENLAADTTVKSFGLYGIADPGMTPSIFISVVWVMTLGIMIFPLMNLLFNKGLDTRIRTLGKKEGPGGFVDIAFKSMFVGLVSVLAIPNLVNFKDPTGIVAVLSAGVLMIFLTFIARKINADWLKGFAFPVSMVIGMGMALVATNIIG